MKVVQINSVNGISSTGKICLAISNLLDKENIENYVICSKSLNNLKNTIILSNDKYLKIQALKSRVFGNYGFNSKALTKKIIKKLDDIKPDIVHIHNIHSHDCNFEILFKYLKNKKIKTFYTFHDCWAFTGYCVYFDIVKCEKWKTECKNCPQYKDYSWFFDKSNNLYKRKKRALQGLDLTIITPSQWLADIVKQSFLKDYPVKVINNGIDLSIFKPTESDFRKKYNLENKFLLLNCAGGMSKRKGFDVLLELSNRLDKEKFFFVLVGTNDAIDNILPNNFVSIHKTNNQEELAKIYSACDLYINPTREDNYPTVNMESIACGTPVLTFRTGGSPECISEKTGAVVHFDDIDAMEKEILRIEKERPFKKENCIEQAKNFDKNKKFNEYIDLYKS